MSMGGDMMIEHYEEKGLPKYKDLLMESRDLLLLCTLLDKSGACSVMVEKIDMFLSE